MGPWGLADNAPAVVVLPKGSIQIVKSGDPMDLDGDSEADAIEFSADTGCILVLFFVV